MFRGGNCVIFTFASRLKTSVLNQVYTGRLFHCLMLSICHLRGVGSILSLLFYFLMGILLATTVDPDETPYNVASDLGLHCCSMTL